jgi:signal transduction histidine kinase
MPPALATPLHTVEPGAPIRGRLDEEAKRSFLRMVSHELRTPLNSIIGFSEILRQELCGPLGNDQYREYAGHIGSSGQKMLKLVNQIVEIVRLESQAEPMDLAAEPLDAVLAETFESLRAEADAWDVAMLAEAPKAMPVVFANPRGLRTVLGNLIQNALAYSPAGAVVSVRAIRAGGQVMIEIRDDGPGFDPEQLPRLMRPFEQGEPTLTRAVDGAGLGLPIAKLLAEAMGGGLAIHTARGQGLTAIVTLPAA